MGSDLNTYPILYNMTVSKRLAVMFLYKEDILI